MRGPEFLARIRDEVLIGDGAFGTLISERGPGLGASYELLNLTHPEFVKELHAAYLTAGAQVLESNTFGANRTKLTPFNDANDTIEVNRTGVELARAVAGNAAFVAGSVGPLAGRQGLQDPVALTEDEIREVFREQIVALAEAGADLLILETFTDLPQLLLALETAKKHTDLPVVCQMAFHEGGHTLGGVHAGTAAGTLGKAGADVIGANCGRGVRCVMAAVQAMTAGGDWPVSAFPNAGLPEYVDGRYLFGAPLPYLVESAVRMADLGVNLIGGCCGTTPEYIRRVSERLRDRKPSPRSRVAVSAQPPAETTALDLHLVPPAGSILDRIRVVHDPRQSTARPFKRPLVVVELDPPRDMRYEPILRRARQLRDMGIDAITMADNPVATLHMGNMALAQIVQKEFDLPVIVHLTCRDHNLLGLQSLLMAANVMGLHHLLALTGDPARVGDEPGASSVYDLNSFGLIELIRKFNNGVNNAGQPLGKRTRFTIGAAFNPNGRNLAGQVVRLRKKIASGAHFAMTQPIYDAERFGQMCDAVADLNCPILVGSMPLLSERNAEFLHNEVPGICLTDDVRRRMKGLSGKDGRQVGLKICTEIIGQMMGRADGFYIIPPHIRTEMAVELVDYIHQCIPRN
jgi:methionine synthase I (cobalamin-dependent)/5,10-methylenetetrahydrofolate reductase